MVLWCYGVDINNYNAEWKQVIAAVEKTPIKEVILGIEAGVAMYATLVVHSKVIIIRFDEVS